MTDLRQVVASLRATADEIERGLWKPTEGEFVHYDCTGAPWFKHVYLSQVLEYGPKRSLVTAVGWDWDEWAENALLAPVEWDVLRRTAWWLGWVEGFGPQDHRATVEWLEQE